MRGVDTPPTEELGTPGETTPLSPVLKDEYIIWEIRKITPPNPIHPRTKKNTKRRKNIFELIKPHTHFQGLTA